MGQGFCKTEPHKLLKPCQTRWLSLHQCVSRILEQWPALLLFFEAEVLEEKTPHADKILGYLRSPYIKAMVEFMDFVLDNLTGLNKLFQSKKFELHRLVAEVSRTVKLFASNFMKIESPVTSLNVDNENRYLPLEKAGVYIIQFNYSPPPF